MDQVDEEGGAAREDHREAEKELAAELVHAEDGPEVTGQRGQGHDEAVDEHLVPGNVEGTVEWLLVWIFGRDLLRDNLTYSLGHVGVCLIKLRQLIKQLREPIPESVISKLDGEIDDQQDQSYLPQWSGEQFLEETENFENDLEDVPALLTILARVLPSQCPHRVLTPGLAGVFAEDCPQQLQGLVMSALAQEELGRLREEDEHQADQEAGAGTGQREPAPWGPGQLVRDDRPGQARHRHITHHPECGQQTQRPAPPPARLKLGKICPHQRYAATHAENRGGDYK